MLTDTERRSGTFKGSGWRSRRRGRWAGAAAGLVAVAAAGLLAAVPAGAQAPPRDATVFVHSAKSGELGGGRLTLHGVSGRVTWAHNSGRSGVMKVKRLHRMLFSAKTATATGTLHVAGHRGGDELTFKLSRPRYNAARRTVSYKIKRLGDGRLPSRGAQAAGVPAPVRPGVAVDDRRPAGLRDRPANHLRLREYGPLQPDLLGRPLCVRHTGQRRAVCQCELFRRQHTAI